MTIGRTAPVCLLLCGAIQAAAAQDTPVSFEDQKPVTISRSTESHVTSTANAGIDTTQPSAKNAAPSMMRCSSRSSAR